MSSINDFISLGGWHQDDRAVEVGLAELTIPRICMADGIKGSGAGKTALLYQYLNKLVGKFNVRLQTIGDCFNPSAMIRMADGSEKPLVDVFIGEEVVTPQGNIRRVIDKIEKPYSGKMVRIYVAGYHKPIDSTPDHQYMLLPNIGRGKRGDKNEYVWQNAISLKEGEYILLPKLPNIKQQEYDLASLDVECKITPSTIRAKGSKNTINRIISLDEKLSWLIGIYSAEGSIDYKNGKYHRITFNLSSDEILLAKKIQTYVRDIFGFEAKIGGIPSKPTVMYVRVANTLIASLFKTLCAGNVYNKKLNNALLLTTYENKLAMLEGWTDGDGWKSRVGVSVSEDLVYDYFELAKSLGINPTILNRKARKRSKKSYGLSLNVTTQLATDIKYAVSLKRTRMTNLGKAAKITKIEIVEPECDKVYCLNIEEDHAFICNGYGVHNCVSMGAACGVDVLRCVQHFLLNTSEDWIAECATEPIYAFSRVEIAGGQLGGGDGSNGIWAAKAMKQYGILIRKKYGNIDLSVYSGQRARQWGMPRAGVPDELEPIAKEHIVKNYSQVRTWEEARDALANGYPVTIASNAGFTSTRDKDGFARPSGSWAHQMCLTAMKDDGRPGALIQNSWGPNWIGGPKGEHDIPDGSFWCDAEVLERNILSAGDSWALSNFDGFPPQKLNLNFF